MASECSPQKVLDFLAKKTSPETVCIIESRWDNRMAWLNSFVAFVDELQCEKYSVNRKTLEVRVQWKYNGPEHVVYLFESYEAACVAAYGTVCLSPSFTKESTT